METSTAFLHSPRTLTRLASMSNVVATRCSWSRAISRGFSRRCEVGASTVVTETAQRVYGGSPERERETPTAQQAALDRVADDLDDVVSRRKKLTVGPPAGETERV